MNGIKLTWGQLNTAFRRTDIDYEVGRPSERLKKTVVDCQPREFVLRLTQLVLEDVYDWATDSVARVVFHGPDVRLNDPNAAEIFIRVLDDDVERQLNRARKALKRMGIYASMIDLGHVEGEEVMPYPTGITRKIPPAAELIGNLRI